MLKSPPGEKRNWIIRFVLGLALGKTIRPTRAQNWRHDIQHNDTWHNDTQHNDTQHNDTQHNDTQHNDTQHNDTA